MNFLTFNLCKNGPLFPKKHFKHYVLASLYLLIHLLDFESTLYLKDYPDLPFRNRQNEYSYGWEELTEQCEIIPSPVLVWLPSCAIGVPPAGTSWGPKSQRSETKYTQEGKWWQPSKPAAAGLELEAGSRLSVERGNVDCHMFVAYSEGTVDNSIDQLQAPSQGVQWISFWFHRQEWWWPYKHMPSMASEKAPREPRLFGRRSEYSGHETVKNPSPKNGELPYIREQTDSSALWTGKQGDLQDRCKMGQNWMLKLVAWEPFRLFIAEI